MGTNTQGRSATVIRLADHRAKYLRPAAPSDPFLADAAISARILRAAIGSAECETGDLWALHCRLCSSLELYVGVEPLAERLRQEAATLGRVIARR